MTLDLDNNFSNHIISEVIETYNIEDNEIDEQQYIEDNQLHSA